MNNQDLSMVDMLFAELDYVEYVKQYIGQEVYNNQAATINAICDPNIRKVIAIHARQTGKTNSVASGCVNIGERQNAKDFGNILIFGPREGQAMLDLARMRTLTQFNARYNDIVDWPSCTKTRLVFKDKPDGKFSRKPGISISAYSAAESANVEGESAGLIILEEAQKISDKMVSEVILPMGGAWDAKIVKIGTPRLRNHFYQSYKDDTYYHCIFPWDQCGILSARSWVMVDEQKVSQYVLERMPRIIKQQYWPDNPIVEYFGRLVHIWDIKGDMNPDDFRTQYMLDWLLDVDLFFSEDEIALLYGNHDIESGASPGAQYFAGLDIAGGSLTDPHDDGRNDWTALTVVKKHPSGMKEVVYKDERYGTDYVQQIEWIRDICDHKRGMFPVAALFADATGCGMPVVDVLRNAMKHVTVVGMMFSRTEPESGKNWKNAMFDHIKVEVDSGKFKYPDRNLVEAHELFNKHMGEWTNLEAKRTTGINKIIRAPGDEHDDGPCADILACYISDRLNHVRHVLKQGGGSRATRPALGRTLG